MTDLERAIVRLDARLPLYAKARRYYRGLQPLQFATEKFTNAFGGLFRAFADNLCAAVVDAVADRLQVTGFGVEAGTTGLDDAAWLIWNQNRMDRKAGEVHQEALLTGDAYIVVWPDSETNRPRLYPNRADLMTVFYDDEQPDRIGWAAKVWELSDGRVRATLYYPDRLEKYVRTERSTFSGDAAGFEPYEDEPIVNNPWGVVPVFHFANNAALGDVGTSELQNAYSLQDALNKSIADMLVAMEAVALPQRWMTGVEVPIDAATGKPELSYQQMYVSKIMAVANEKASFGEFGQADITQFLQVQDSFRFAIARDTGTPLHYMELLRDPPSGEALKTLEARFVKKCLDRTVAFGNSWEDSMTLALRMAGLGSPATRLTTHWSDPAPRSEKTEAETLEIKSRVGVTWKQLMREFSYSDQTIAEMEQETERQAPAVNLERSRAALAADTALSSDVLRDITGGAT